MEFHMHSEKLLSAIVAVVTAHYRKYQKHDLYRRRWEEKRGKSWHQRNGDAIDGDIRPAYTGYHQPFISRTALWVESGAAMFARPFDFDLAVDSLIQKKVLAVVDREPLNPSG